MSQHNQAFIDGQNLYLATAADSWQIDFDRLHNFLHDQYRVDTAYYFVGYLDQRRRNFYSKIEQAGFTIIFREHHRGLTSAKKGNVDTDIVFHIMKKLVEREKIHNFYLLSGDGDYYRLVQYLHNRNKLGKILHPTHASASSLYKLLPDTTRIFLDDPDIKALISHQQKRGLCLGS